MKLATLKNGTRDGALVVVSRDLERLAQAAAIAPTLLTALERWDKVQADLAALYDDLNAGRLRQVVRFDPARCAAPLPRSPQWLDGSAFLNHARLMERAFNMPPLPDLDRVPLVYQGASDDFLGACDDVALPRVKDQIDFEGEFGVILRAVPLGVSPSDALSAVALITQINDWSLRAFGPREMRTGFGFVQAKPSTAFGPVVVTPDELGRHWHTGRCDLDLHVWRNGVEFGRANGSAMHFHFGEIVAHAAHTRSLSAGTVVGSGTVANADPSVGSSCIAERRALEILERGAPITGFMSFGESVRMQAKLPGAPDAPLFGCIDQKVVPRI